MDTKLKFSDLIRYILLGSLATAVYLITAAVIIRVVDESLFRWLVFKASDLLRGLSQAGTLTFAVVIALAVFFLMGAAVQGLRFFMLQQTRRLYRFRPMERFFEYLYGNTDDVFLPTVGRILIAPSIFYDIYNYCRVLKFKRNSTETLPRWIYISDRPEVLCEVIEKVVSGREGDLREDDRHYISEFLTSLLVCMRSCMLIYLPFLFICPRVIGIFIGALFLLCLLTVAWAKSFNSEYIKSLGMAFRAMAVRDEDMATMNRIMVSQGAPRAYVLVRTCDAQSNYLSLTLQSIEKQSYANVWVIVQEDVAGGEKMKSAAVRSILDEYDDAERHPKLAGHIAYSCGNFKGPAGAIFNIRKSFLKIAGKQDVAIILDDDDQFRRDTAVEDIILAMTRGKANICLTSFESKGELEMDITNNGGKVHNDLIREFSEKSSRSFNPDLCYASSIGWTKSCRYDIVSEYDDLISGRSAEFCRLSRFEDFPDFLMLLFKDAVVTGVQEATHSYYKRPDRVTTRPSEDDFSRCRAGFLKLTLELVNDHADGKFFGDIAKARRHALEFVIFKTCQIEDIYHKFFDTDLKRPDAFTDSLFKLISKDADAKSEAAGVKSEDAGIKSEAAGVKSETAGVIEMLPPEYRTLEDFRLYVHSRMNELIKEQRLVCKNLARPEKS